MLMISYVERNDLLFQNTRRCAEMLAAAEGEN